MIKFKNSIKSALLIIFSVFFAFSGTLPAFANDFSQFVIDEDLLEFYNENGINGYNPNAKDDCLPYYGGSANVQGTAVTEKVWNGLVSLGFTDVQAAAIMGNMLSESGFHPAVHYKNGTGTYGNLDFVTNPHDGDGGHAIGLVQWYDYSRRQGLLKQFDDAGARQLYEKYFLNPYQYNSMSAEGFLAAIGEADFDMLLKIELEFVRHEFDTKYGTIFTYTGNDETALHDATQYVLAVYENPKTGASVDGEYSARLDHARDYYQLYTGTGPSGGGTSADSSDIIIIGDSLTVGATDAIKQKLPNADINAEIGRHFSTGVEIAKSASQNTIVLALGTNDNGIEESTVDDAINAIGTNKKIYLMTNYANPTNGFNYAKNNVSFANAAQKYSNVSVINWAEAVDNAIKATGTTPNPGQYLASDGIHLTADGQTLFADVIYKAVAGGGGSYNNNYCAATGALKEGGMTLAEAEGIMEEYKRLPSYKTEDELWELVGKSGCAGGYIYNCVAFSRWFINTYTGAYLSGKTVSIGNGGDVVTRLTQEHPDDFTYGGHTPQVYSIFSTRTIGSLKCNVNGQEVLCGHTGVVLGIDTARQVAILGDAACGDPATTTTPRQPKAYEKPLSQLTNGDYEFAYPKVLKTGLPNAAAANGASVSASGDTLTIKIPNLTKKYTLAWISDLHLDLDPAKNDTSRWGGNKSSRSRLDSVIATLNRGGYDAVIFGGDIMDYYTQTNGDAVHEAMKTLNKPWFYITGGFDHDRNDGYAGADPGSAVFSSGSYNGADQIDLGEIAIVGLNDSSMGNRNISEVQNYIDRIGKPVILATHVPFDDPSGSIATQVSAPNVHGNRYLWTSNPASSHWDINTNDAMKSFVNTYLYNNSNVKVVLCGHVHAASIQGSLGSAQEHIFQAAANNQDNGQFGVINIEGGN